VYFQNYKVPVVRAYSERVGRSACFINQVRIKNVELVALHHLWWRVIHIIMSGVVLVPFKSSVNTIEIPKFVEQAFHTDSSTCKKI